jgi:hypothetical protein
MDVVSHRCRGILTAKPVPSSKLTNPEQFLDEAIYYLVSSCFELFYSYFFIFDYPCRSLLADNNSN